MPRVYGNRVEVKTGRAGRALRIDGTFASLYRPGRALTGPVWNALAAPLAWLPASRRNAVLILGLGGGSAARIARALAPRARIVGVEKSREVVRAARRHLGMDALGVEVVVADALAYLEKARGRFDCVIEDVFVGRGRRVHKPDWLPEPGLRLAARRVAPGGLLTSNQLDEFPESAATLGELFPSRVAIAIDDWDNRILVAGQTDRTRGRHVSGELGQQRGGGRGPGHRAYIRSASPATSAGWAR